MRATRALIHLNNLRFNIASIRCAVGQETALCIPVKADGYGHGAVRIAVAAIRAGASYLAVASVQEGVELREAGIVAPILLFSLPIPEELDEVIRNGITPLVADAHFARELSARAAALGETAAVHLKIDSGMGRIGCRPEDAPALAREIALLPALKLEGTATHLAVSDSLKEEDRAYTMAQISCFSKAVQAIRDAGIDPGIVHAAASGAVVQYPEARFDMVRPGLLVYGYPPIEEWAERVPVKPVMELETQVVFLKNVQKGQSISYGRLWTAPRDTCIATLPVGYADGLARRLSGKLSVRIAGKDYPLVGRICMDQCMVDLGPGSSVARYEKAVIFGPEGPVSAAGVAQALLTIPYEVTCAINKRVPRVYIEQETPC